MNFDKCVESYNHHYHHDVEYLHRPRKFPPVSLQSIPCPQLWPLANPHLRFVITVSLSRISYKWNHTECYLSYLTWHCILSYICPSKWCLPAFIRSKGRWEMLLATSVCLESCYLVMTLVDKRVAHR